MTFLPIVERELRVASRRPGTYWMRAAVVLVVVVVSAWIFMVNPGARSSEIGRILFHVLTAGAGFYCLFAGVRTTADCLSEEKREGTLGLLFLTSLKGYDVVLGKLVANALNPIYGVLSIIPALGIPILLGGTSAGQFVRVTITLVGTLLFSLAAGMMASAICRSSRKARSLAFLIIFAFTVASPALGAWVSHATRSDVVMPFLLPSPVFTFVAGLDAQYIRLGDGFYWSATTVFVLGFAFLGVAALITPRAWQDLPMPSRATKGASESVSSVADPRRKFRIRLLAVNPFYWLAARPWTRVFHVWYGFGFIGLVWLWGIFKFGRDWFSIGIYVATSFFLNSLIKVWFASESCRQIASERKNGTLELLLATPLSVRQIIDGQRLALQRQFAAPLLVTMLLETLMLGAMLRESGFSGAERTMWPTLWLLSLILLWLDVAAFFWFGLWQGLTARDARRAYTRMISAILVLPWVLFAGFLGGVGIGAFGPAHLLTWKVFVGVWFGLGVAVDCYFGLTARQRLVYQFRQRATERFQARANVAH